MARKKASRARQASATTLPELLIQAAGALNEADVPTAIEAYLAQGGEVNTAVQVADANGDPMDMALLSMAVFKGREVCVRSLVAAGASVSVTGAILLSRKSHQRTLLMWAAVKRHLMIMEVLLDAGADMLQADAKGFTILHECVKFEFVPGLKLVLDRGMPIDSLSSGKEETTALLHAARQGYLQVVQVLLDRGS